MSVKTEWAIDGAGRKVAVVSEEGGGIHPLSQKFIDILEEMLTLHLRKQADYGQPDDPFANVRGCEDWGVDPWVGATIRGMDKMRRLQAYTRNGSLQNEGVEDSLIDLAVYSVIALVLFREQEKK